MSSSKASSDPVDLEKGVSAVTRLRKEELEELSAVDPCKSKSSSRVILLLRLDELALLYVRFFVGFMAWAIRVSNTWTEPLPALLMLLLIVVVAIELTTKMKEECIQGQGHDDTETEGSDDEKRRRQRS